MFKKIKAAKSKFNNGKILLKVTSLANMAVPLISDCYTNAEDKQDRILASIANSALTQHRVYFCLSEKSANELMEQDTAHNEANRRLGTNKEFSRAIGLARDADMFVAVDYKKSQPTIFRVTDPDLLALIGQVDEQQQLAECYSFIKKAMPGDVAVEAEPAAPAPTPVAPAAEVPAAKVAPTPVLTPTHKTTAPLKAPLNEGLDPAALVECPQEAVTGGWQALEKYSILGYAKGDTTRYGIAAETIHICNYLGLDLRKGRFSDEGPKEVRLDCNGRITSFTNKFSDLMGSDGKPMPDISPTNNQSHYALDLQSYVNKVRELRKGIMPRFIRPILAVEPVVEAEGGSTDVGDIVDSMVKQSFWG